MTRIALSSLIAVLVVSLGLVGWAAAGAQKTVTTGYGNYTLNGAYEFQADGVVEENGVPKHGFWEVGRFNADGNGNITDGVEYSSMLSGDEAVIDQKFTFSGTYTVNPDGTATGEVTVNVGPGIPPITKKLWLIVHSVGKDGIADGFDGGHAEADLTTDPEIQRHGNARSHVGHRIEIAK